MLKLGVESGDQTVLDALSRGVALATVSGALTVNLAAGDLTQSAALKATGASTLIVTGGNIVLTASHVVANAEAIMVQFFDGESIQATTVRISRAADVAVIQLANARLKLAMGRMNAARRLADIAAAHLAEARLDRDPVLGLTPDWLRGEVSAVRHEVRNAL